MDEWVDRSTDGPMDGWMDGGVDKRMVDDEF